jgi:MFS family permease
MEQSKSFHYGYVIVFCCFLIMGVNIGIVMSCAGIFYKPVSDDLGVTVGKFGLYMTFIYAFSFLALSFAGKLMEKYSARWLLTGSSAVVGLVLMGMSKFTSVWQFYIAGAVNGLALAFLLYLSYPVLVNRWFERNVGFYIGLCSAASGIGGVVLNPLGGYLLGKYGWRDTYLIFGVSILIGVTPFLGLLLRDHPVKKVVKTDNQLPQTGMSYSEAIRSPVFYFLLVFAFFMISVSTLNLFIPNYLTSSGLSVEQAAYVASAIMLGVTTGKVALGFLNDKNPLAGLVVCIGSGLTGLILFVLNFNYNTLPVAGFLFGWAYAGVTVETALLVRTIFGNKNYSQIFSNVSTALALGGAVMAGGWGLLSDILNFQTILILGIGLLFVAGLIGFLSLNSHKRNLEK